MYRANICGIRPDAIPSMMSPASAAKIGLRVARMAYGCAHRRYGVIGRRVGIAMSAIIKLIGAYRAANQQAAYGATIAAVASSSIISLMK